jgi:hypothetical protein
MYFPANYWNHRPFRTCEVGVCSEREMSEAEPICSEAHLTSLLFL